MQFSPITIIMLVLLAAVVIFMFRSSRKRQRQQAEMREQIKPGAEVMTNFGLFGKLKEIDDEHNHAYIETSPGHVIKVHRQVIARVVDPSENQSTTIDEESDVVGSDPDLATASTTPASQSSTQPELNADHAEPLPEPQYGERIETSTSDHASGRTEK